MSSSTGITATPLAASSADISAATEAGLERASSKAEIAAEIQNKYQQERNKRIRSDGNEQYIDFSKFEQLKQYQEDPWFDESTQPTVSHQSGSKTKYLIIGAGFGGLMYAARLVDAGVNVKDLRIVDTAGGYGGTWYWNRYPGLMCDVESSVYMPFLEELNYIPKHRYAYGPELRQHAENIADHWKLQDSTIFRTVTKSLTWDEEEKEWVAEFAPIGTGAGLATSKWSLRSQFVLMTPGILSIPKLPGIPGLETFKGYSFHTSRWDYLYTGGSPTDNFLTKLKDKKVGIIGTGATSIQVVPELAKWAKELYVIQRTPSGIDIRGQAPIDPAQWRSEVATKKGWQQDRMENFSISADGVSKPKVDLVHDQWTQIPSFQTLIGAPPIPRLDQIPAYVASLHEKDLPRQERIRARVDEVVKDRDTAEKLKPWYPTWCKRPCFHDDYLAAFNLPNVKLIDTDGKGVDRMTPSGIVVDGKETKLDLLIFSTGYRSLAGDSAATRSNTVITGRDGKLLTQKWIEGIGTLHGVISNGFPNLILCGPVQAAATVNLVHVYEQLSKHVAYILAEADKKASAGQKYTIEPTSEAEEEWTMKIMAGAAVFAGLSGCTPSYLNGEGAIDKPATPEQQMKGARGSLWGNGIVDYARVIDEWRKDGGLKGLEVKIVA